MAFKPIKSVNTSIETPEALYRDLRNRKIEGLISPQPDILREYIKQGLNEKDIAIQLPTGSGKTLVGLLIGEWRRRKYNERVVYLCPTIQLVNQVVEKSTQEYGIKCNPFIGKRSDFTNKIKSEYIDKDTIAITTYSALFNTNSFFNDHQADILILDDAHSAENYIAKYWSLMISRQYHNELFENLLTVFCRFLSPEDKLRLTSSSYPLSDPQWTQKIPTPDLVSSQSELIQLFDEYNKKENSNSKYSIKYSWSVLRDHLLACHVYLNDSQILIRPLIPPTTTHPPFKNPKQRIYMSATMGEGGDLERLTGVENIKRLNVPDGWDQQGIGRRLFLFPEKTFDENQSLDITMRFLKETLRAFVLTSDTKEASEFQAIVEKQGYQVFNTQQLEQSKKDFVQTEKAVAILANRYDGIDLSGDECRLLIMKNLQRATNLQEKFLVTRLAASILLNDRILTRVVQAVGRCTRSATDYSAVVILGDEISRILSEKQKFLHPELQAEIQFGIEQSKETSINDFIDNLQIFLKHEDDWNDVDEDILTKRNSLAKEKLPGIDQLQKAVVHEIRYQYHIWYKNYEKAIAECESVLNFLSGDDVKGYRAFWNYLAGSTAWLAAKDNLPTLEAKARKFFNAASNIAPEVNWFVKLSKLYIESNKDNSLNENLNNLIENLERNLVKMGLSNSKKFEREVQFILDGITRDIMIDATEQDKEKFAREFEDAHVKLGNLLGYRADNSQGQADPDPWWIINSNLCIVFEDNSSRTSDNALGANKVRQAASHPNWIRAKVAELSTDAEIITVFITSCNQLQDGALPHAQDVCYWNLQDFKTWTRKAITVIRKLRSSFAEEADLEWRRRAALEYKDHNIAPDLLIRYLKAHPLRDLPVV